MPAPSYKALADILTQDDSEILPTSSIATKPSNSIASDVPFRLKQGHLQTDPSKSSGDYQLLHNKCLEVEESLQRCKEESSALQQQYAQRQHELANVRDIVSRRDKAASAMLEELRLLLHSFVDKDAEVYLVLIDDEFRQLAANIASTKAAASVDFRLSSKDATRVCRKSDTLHTEDIIKENLLRAVTYMNNRATLTREAIIRVQGTNITRCNQLEAIKKRTEPLMRGLSTLETELSRIDELRQMEIDIREDIRLCSMNLRPVLRTIEQLEAQIAATRQALRSFKTPNNKGLSQDLNIYKHIYTRVEALSSRAAETPSRYGKDIREQLTTLMNHLATRVFVNERCCID